MSQLFDDCFRMTQDANAAATLALAEVNLNGRAPLDNDTLNPPAIAKRLHVRPSTVYEWIKTGQLKASNIATGERPKWVIQRDDFDRFLKSRQQDMAPSSRRTRRPVHMVQPRY